MFEVRGLWAGYPGRQVLTGVDLTVGAGEVVALVGPNGCGKTTLIRAATGVIKPKRGTVYLGADDAAALSARERACRVAVVPQGVALPSGFTVMEQVLLGRTPHIGTFSSEGPADLAAVRRAMVATDCWPLADRHVEQLSGGERQRVVLARALAQEPRILLLDEPTANLDPGFQVRTFQLSARLGREQGIAVLAAVHDLSLASLFADRIALLYEGKITLDGPADEVLRPDVIERVYGLSVVIVRHPTSGRPVALPNVEGNGSRAAAPSEKPR